MKLMKTGVLCLALVCAVSAAGCGQVGNAHGRIYRNQAVTEPPEITAIPEGGEALTGAPEIKRVVHTVTEKPVQTQEPDPTIVISDTEPPVTEAPEESEPEVTESGVSTETSRSDESGTETSESGTDGVGEPGDGPAECIVYKDGDTTPTGARVEVIDGLTYVDGVLIVNKSYGLPEEYAPGGLMPEAESAFYEMAQAAAEDNIWLYIVSGYRSYWYQSELYWGYRSWRGLETESFSARAGFSEHQSGFAMDINDASRNFVGTPEAQWIEEHCVDYGFIIRYPEGKESITGFVYEPWHVRYLGKEKAREIADSGLTLEEYYGLTSVYEVPVEEY